MTLENAAGTGASAHPAGLPEKQSKSAQEKKEEVVVVFCGSSANSCVIQSEEDKQLAETLGMLVERLQVHGKRPCDPLMINFPVGAGYKPAQAGA